MAGYHHRQRRRSRPFLANFTTTSHLCMVFIASFSAAMALVRSSEEAAVGHHSSSSACPQNLSLLVHVPCLLEYSAETAGGSLAAGSPLEKLDSCDLLAEVAMDMAVERVNRDNGVLTGSRTLTKEFLFSTSDLATMQNNDTIPGLARQVRDAFRFITSNDYFGIIGPSESGAAAFWAPLFYRSDLMTISYEVTGNEVDNVFSFYRTLPSDLATNIGRIGLVSRFDWLRIAVVSSQDRYYSQVSGNFLDLFHKFLDEDEDLLGDSWMASFSDSPMSALKGVKHRNISIIFGFFGEKRARNVLCQASSLGLVSKHHAWILPSYYNPNWWRLTNRTQRDECSDEAMEDILESIIFVGSVKYPPMDMTLDEFHRQLIAKSHDLFPSLTEEDLKPYLLRSRATNAYDAVTLLAKSVGVALTERGGDSCEVDLDVMQVAMEEGLMECEYCRMNAECFLNASEAERCQELCGRDYTSVQNFSTLFSSPHSDKLRSRQILKFYGQVTYTQFIGGTECHVGLYLDFTKADNFSAFTPIIYSLDDLEQLPCARRLNIMKDNFVTGDGRCPSTFKWRGDAGPPASNHVIKYGYPEYQFVIVGLTTALGLVISMVFLVFNIIWRKNKTVKASSPWLNVILIIGYMIRLPALLLGALAVSAIKYNFSIEAMHKLCHFPYILNYIGDVIFVSALIVKNWRLYRIFHNRGMRLIGKKLTDRRLSIGILVLSAPVIALLIAIVASNVRLDVQTFSDERNLQFHRFSYCTSDNFRVLDSLLDVYISFLLLILLFISFLASLANSSTFRREALLSLRAVTIALVPIVSVYILRVFLELTFTTVSDIRYFLWIRYAERLFLPTVILLILYGPSLYIVAASHVRSKRRSLSSVREQTSVRLATRYNQLIKERDGLKKQLSEINDEIAKVMKERQDQALTLPSSLAEAHPLPLSMEEDNWTKSGDKCQSDNSTLAVNEESLTSTKCIETLFTYFEPTTDNDEEKRHELAQPCCEQEVSFQTSEAAAVVVEHSETGQRTSSDVLHHQIDPSLIQTEDDALCNR